MTREIDSRINVQGLSVVHLNGYKLTEVIAELIDNSIDSYVKNKMNGTLIVDICFKSNEVIYKDNAYGFDSKSFDRAFQTHIDNSENVTYGTYGVGMKHALLWLGEYTIIETYSLKEKCGYRTEYPKIIDNQVQDSLTLEENVDLNLGDFNTKFTICEARYLRYNANDLLDLKSSLEEIYKYHSNYLQISIDGYLLNYAPKYEILNARYVGDYTSKGDVVCLDNADSRELFWKYELKEPINITEGGNIYSLSGFVGLQKGTSAPESGIRIYRNNRCVLGFSAMDRYRPFGSNNSHESKTFIGELHIEGFKKVTIGHGLPEMNMLTVLITHLEAGMRQGDFNDTIADKMFKQASKFRITIHLTAPLCATVPEPREPRHPVRPTRGSGDSGRTAGGTVKLPSTVKSYKIQIADQTYNVKSELASGPPVVDTRKRDNGEVDIEIKINSSLQEISIKLFTEIYDLHQKFNPLTGLDPNDELKRLLNRLGS